ncbi:TetR/AcrR family transcriptional regulator [Virgibacillus sp. W0181]|uniref:TetR/AcrR family transcriptional regulator n=1 Tax=Virgibacillus sp. W0181 TaxID=3391581 RepID=UPI003F45AB72
MNGFERRTAKIKQRIKQATLELLMDMDPRTLRIADVVARANVSQVTIYNHFGSKEKLIRESVQSWYIEILEATRAYLQDDTKSFQDKVAFIIFNKKTTLHQFSISKLDTLIWQDDEMKNFVEEIYHNQALPLTLELIEQGRKEGAIHHNFPSSLIMFYLNLFMEKAEALTDYAKNYGDEDAFIEDMMQLFFYGVAGKS